MSTRAHVRAERGLGRQLAWYFGGLVVVYAVGLVAFWPPEGQQPNQAIFLVLMFAPTVGALLARFVAGGRIQWGRPNWWLLAGQESPVEWWGLRVSGGAA